jgi:hypothetical protein
MTAVPVSYTIQVDLQVSSYQEFSEDGIVQVWGHTGDYEVSVWLPIDDQRVGALRAKGAARPSRKRAGR